MGRKKKNAESPTGINSVEELKERVVEIAKEYGFKKKENESSDGNAILRVNLKDEQGANFFGFIRPEESFKELYSDLSLVFFTRHDTSSFFISLGVGSLGFTNDYELACQPGLRRKFLRLLKGETFVSIKPNLSDIEQPSEDFEKFVSNNCIQFTPIVRKYSKYLPVIKYLDYKDNDIEAELRRWISTYASIRNWATNNRQRKAISAALSTIKTDTVNDIDNIKKLLLSYQFIVLQGAPGTGKTLTANKIAKEFPPENVLFIQFHAETSYSDFIFGIEPDLDNVGSFKKKEGILYKAIERANEASQKGEKVLLIIDEINRANLSNVLGPSLYLFEKNSQSRIAEVTIGDLKLKSIPSNLFIIATMNTADRSLAVVDFALRRRFAWYTLRPRPIQKQELRKHENFHVDLFNEVSNIFETYATDEELNLQPGQSYFLFTDEDSIKDKIEYELMPLIKEYLNEGFLPKAKESFSNFFYKWTNKQLFE